jgi:hypothetical protein
LLTAISVTSSGGDAGADSGNVLRDGHARSLAERSGQKDPPFASKTGVFSADFVLRLQIQVESVINRFVL